MLKFQKSIVKPHHFYIEVKENEEKNNELVLIDKDTNKIFCTLTINIKRGDLIINTVNSSLIELEKIMMGEYRRCIRAIINGTISKMLATAENNEDIDSMRFMTDVLNMDTSNFDKFLEDIYKTVATINKLK